ncbi:MAG: hypothetical protein O3C57_08350, partial [Verrucomicrobia bacterium]|nr:hypothetical protein [Verrucomicrobiota bacterium]
MVREVRYPFTQYISGRNIGDEYRYVLERQFAPKFAGSLLTRPGLILNPWMLRETYAEREVLRRDEAYKGYAQPMTPAADAPVVMSEAIVGGRQLAPRRSSGLRAISGNAGKLDDRMQATGELGFDFLPQGAILANNLHPDKDGVLLLPLADSAEQTFVDIYLSDRYGTARYRVLLADSELTPRDQRLRQGLDPKRSFSRQKRVRRMDPKTPVTFEDVGTARYSVLQTLGDAFDLLQTLGGTADLEKFAFLKQWPTLSDDDKRAKLNEFACHELHLFLYYKDPEFFAAVVKPYLAHKKDKTFVDRWLLGETFKDELDLYDLSRRNALEQWLWAQRTGDARRVKTTFTEAWELLPPNPDERNAWILAALNLSGLDESAAGAVMNMDEAGASNYLGKNEMGDKKPVDRVALKSASAAEPAATLESESSLSGRRSKDARERKEMNFGLDLQEKAQSDDDLVNGRADRDGQYEGWEMQLAAKAKAQEKRLYRKLPLTKEWAEQNYYNLRARADVPERLPPSTFWKDLADGLTLPPSLPGAHRNLTEIIAALAISDLRFKAPEVVEDRDGARLTLTVAVPALLISEEVLPAEASKDARPLLLSQQFYRPDDMFRFEGNEQIEKFVTGEFVRRVVYGGRVTLTNPTASRRRMSVLLQIPVGAVPLQNGFYTDDRTLLLEPYTTQKIDYFFYFPEAGTFAQYPAHAAVDEAIVGKADPRSFTVVEAPTEIDRTSWEWVSQNASSDEVLDFLSQNNIRRLDLDLMAWRMGDKAFFEACARLLAEHLHFHATSYSYAFKHRDIPHARVWLEHSPLAQRVGPALASTLLTVDPVARVYYEHLEYDPLVNPRAHPVGAERKILNTAMRDQYAGFLNI